ncbi:MAG: class I SAM-dependent methyltransferase [Bryobacteraceae bacterium]
MTEQTTLWNGVAGRAWVDTQELLDRVFKPFETLLVNEVGTKRRVLDVGCGTGATTVAIARALGPDSEVVGVDISEPMVQAARERGSSASFVCANAQTHAFDGPFDMVVSRFGVMFFDDPVAAFGNLRRVANEMRLITWRGPAENPFMTTAERAAAPLLDLPPRVPDAPGQFGLADPQRIERSLRESGWTDIDIRPLDVACSFAEADLVSYFTRLGPVGLVFREVDEQTQGQVIETVGEAFRQYVQGGEVRFPAACWLVSARSGAAC